MSVLVINKQYQITIPKSFRDKLRLQAGDKVDIQLDSNEHLIIKPLHRIMRNDISAESVVDDSFGLWRGEKESLQYINEIMDEAEDRLKELGLG